MPICRAMTAAFLPTNSLLAWSPVDPWCSTTFSSSRSLLLVEKQAPARPSCSASASAMEATAMISFSAVQMMLLSIEAPSTMPSAATLEVGRLVDDRGRIARTGGDHLLAAGPSPP